ncbi:MAG: hypothetical protein ACTSPK_01125 [Candidatus Heimdallarchaeota archaeon]
MAIEAFSLFTLYKAIELMLIFWLLALLLKWVLTFIFGEKGSRIFSFIGYVVNFQIKKFILSKIFKIDVQECDPGKLKFTHDETKRWDVLFTSLIFIPLSLGLVVGSLLGTLGMLIQEDLVVLSIICYVVGFIVAITSVPSYKDVQELKESSVRSIVIWFIIATLLSSLLGVLFVPFIEITLGIILAVILGVLLTTIFTFYIPFISDKMESEDNQTFIGGTVDLDG